MAYGKIKADTFVYDNSGSDVEVTVSTIPTGASPTFTGNLTMNAQGDIRLADSDSSNYVGFQAPATVSSNVVWTLPAADGTAGFQLTTDGSGTLSWAAATNVAAGSLSGTTIAANVVTSSLTTVGTLGGLTVDGDVTFTGASSNGLWDKSANAFVANVTGNLTGNASGSAATVTGAAQTAITSVGTLTGLTVAGNYAQTLTSDGGFTATAAGNHAIKIIGDANRSADTNTLLSVHGKWNGTNVATIDFQAGNDTTNKDNGQIVFYTAAAGSVTEALRITEDQNASFAGVVQDSKGDLRTIVQTSKSSAHTIVAADSGKHSINSTGGWTFNTSTGFTAGQAITLINNSGSDQTITNTGCTMYLGGDTSSKSTLTLKGRGIATFICTASNVYYGSGAGLE